MAPEGGCGASGWRRSTGGVGCAAAFLRGGRGGEVEGGADAALDDRAGQAAGDRVGGLPAGAVRLVIQDQRVRLPAAATPGMVDREPLLESGDPVNLSGDQHRPVMQERRLLLLDDGEVGLFQRASAGSWGLEQLVAGSGRPMIDSQRRAGAAN
jgi:hypothetical protein